MGKKKRTPRRRDAIAPNTGRRITDTMERAAKWTHRQRPLLAGGQEGECPKLRRTMKPK